MVDMELDRLLEAFDSEDESAAPAGVSTEVPVAFPSRPPTTMTAPAPTTRRTPNLHPSKSAPPIPTPASPFNEEWPTWFPEDDPVST